MVVLLVFTVPPKLMLLGAVATKPPANVMVSPDASPNFKPRVFKNCVAPVTLVLVPKSSNT
jgi:hypothetical protein